MGLNIERLERVLGTSVRGCLTGDGVTSVAYDSRLVGPGTAFVAVPGFKRDGMEFVPEALRRGAALIVAERDPGISTETLSRTPVAVVPDARAALAALACTVSGDPSEEFEVYGVTGTNGKTTTSYALHAIFAEDSGAERSGLMGTAGTISAGIYRPAVRTSPEAVEVQGTLAEMLRDGVRRVVMEVSSHGIALHRVSGTRFAGAMFTNLSRDHLDLHGTMEEYYKTKRKLFYRASGPKIANADDAWGRRLAGEVRDVRTFGVAEDADYRIKNVQALRLGTAFSLERRGAADLALETPLLGGYNVSNVAGAAALALAAGVGEETLQRAVRNMPQVPGRFERVATAAREDFEVIVDYAHTDVGLEAALDVAREVAETSRSERGSHERGRVICVFGAAGERDGAKRPIMGRVAARLSDLAIVTTDDAYTEDPGEIAREVAGGAGGPKRCEIILDRRAAIRRALESAEPGDVVLVAGKGHETVQHLPDGDVPFHDASVVTELLEELAAGPGDRKAKGFA